jgi:hypothetical protein
MPDMRVELCEEPRTFFAVAYNRAGMSAGKYSRWLMLGLDLMMDAGRKR